MRTPLERAAPSELKFWINGKEATSGTVQRSVPLTFTASETFDVGQDTCSPNEFNKRFGWKNDPDKARISLPE